MLAAAYSPDGLFIATSAADKTVVILSTMTGTPIGLLNVGRNIQALSFSVDGERLALGGFGGVDVWDVGLSKNLFGLSSAWSVHAKYAADGKRLIGTDGTRPYTWDTETGNRSEPSANPPSFTDQIEMSPDGKHILGIEDRFTASVWRIAPN